MINLEAIEKLAEKTGIGKDICDKVVKTVEKEADPAAILKLATDSGALTKLIPIISEKSGVAEDIVKKIIDVLPTVLSGGLGGLSGLNPFGK